MEGAYLLPVNLFAMSISKGDGPLCTPLYGAALQKKNGIFRSVKSLDELLQVIIFQCPPFAWATTQWKSVQAHG
jgi:hypothetical protein